MVKVQERINDVRTRPASWILIKNRLCYTAEGNVKLSVDAVDCESSVDDTHTQGRQTINKKRLEQLVSVHEYLAV